MWISAVLSFVEGAATEAAKEVILEHGSYAELVSQIRSSESIDVSKTRRPRDFMLSMSHIVAASADQHPVAGSALTGFGLQCIYHRQQGES